MAAVSPPPLVLCIVPVLLILLMVAFKANIGPYPVLCIRPELLIVCIILH